VVDESKVVERLGTTFPIPVEVLCWGLAYVDKSLREMAAEPALRMAVAKDGRVVTDNGQLVLDVRFPPATDLRVADQRMHSIPGVIETGLFFDLATKVLVGGGGPAEPTLRTLTRKA